MSLTRPVDANYILKGWQELTYTPSSVASLQCLKDSNKSSIWKIELAAPKNKQPVILKIFKPLKRQRKKNTVETRLYRRAHSLLTGLMPTIYHTQKRVLGHDLWCIMEYVRPLQGQIQFSPAYFHKIIPTLALLHARTFNEAFHRNKNMFGSWLPQYDHPDTEEERHIFNNNTKILIDAAMKRPELYRLIRPHYKKLINVLEKGPNYFPSVIEAGQSLTHNDLQLPNIGCNNINDGAWQVIFLDWEGAKFAPCWFDMVNLVGVFLAYRHDWRHEEPAIIKHCAEQYAAEMKKQGITFKREPLQLYKMAYLQHILEKGLYLQLSWELSGRKRAYLLPGYLDKFACWGKELRLL